MLDICIEPEIDVEYADPTNGEIKSGKPRIRRKFKKSVETRLEEKKKIKLEKMAVKPGCNEMCTKNACQI